MHDTVDGHGHPELQRAGAASRTSANRHADAQELAPRLHLRYDGTIMMSRTQIVLDPENHRRARQRAAALGVSLAEYIRRLVAKDMETPREQADATSVFDLGHSGKSDVAVRKDQYLGEALSERSRGTRRGRRRAR
ncbi:MAG TPA: hypothetical protein VGJ84_08205 [Polyangiaceae bacterium]